MSALDLPPDEAVPALPNDAAPATSPSWNITTKAIVAVTTLILAAVVIWRFHFLITPLVAAGILAYLVNPFVRWLQRKLAIKRSLAVLIVYLFTFLVIGALSVALGLVAVEQSARLWRDLPGLLPRLVEVVRARVDAAADVVWVIGPYQVNFGELSGMVNWDALSDELRQPLQSAAGQGGRWLANFAQATVSTLGNLLLVLTVSIYLAIDAPRIGQVIGDIAHQPGYRYDADRLITMTMVIWNAYLRGQVVLGFVIGVVVAVVLALLGVSNSLALGVLSGLLEFLPVIGPVIGAFAAVLVALFQGDNPFGLAPWSYGLLILGVMFAVQQVENNLLVPRIVGDALDLHPIIVIIAVLMGTSLAGLLGAVLAAPVAASLKLYGTYVWRKMLDLPPFPEPAVPEATVHPGGPQWFDVFSRTGSRQQQK
jgi:predicted PurR-regulated permease PerM